MDDDPRGAARWLAGQAAADPAVISRAHRHLTSSGRSNDAAAAARRYLEWQWRLDPLHLPDATQWRQAARLAERAGHPRAALVLDAAAEVDTELQAMADAWTARYQTRPPAETSAALARLIAAGAVQARPVEQMPGIDGSWYQMADLTPLPGYPAEPVVLITTMTGQDLAGGFTSEASAAAWFSDRARAQDRPRRAWPVNVPAVEHLPRVTLEEQALAWLLHRSGRLPDGSVMAGDLSWTADSRREIAAALRTVTAHGEQSGPELVAAELGRRMLRAPGWAADQVGWPAGHVTQQYLARLAATRVTGRDARHAFAALAVDAAKVTDPVIRELTRRYGTGPDRAKRVARAPERSARIAGEREQRAAELYARYGPYWNRPDSVGARMRITGPRI